MFEENYKENNSLMRNGTQKSQFYPLFRSTFFKTQLSKQRKEYVLFYFCKLFMFVPELYHIVNNPKSVSFCWKHLTCFLDDLACCGMHLLLCMYSLRRVLSTRRTYRYICRVNVINKYSFP